MRPIIIDVRTAAEYAVGHIEGAVNIPLDEIGARIRMLPDVDEDSPILLYCRVGARSAVAQAILEEQGYTRVPNGGSLSALSVRYPVSACPDS